MSPLTNLFPEVTGKKKDVHGKILRSQVGSQTTKADTEVIPFSGFEM